MVTAAGNVGMGTEGVNQYFWLVVLTISLLTAIKDYVT